MMRGSLFIRYDECRHPRWGTHPLRINNYSKKTLPTVPRRGPDAGVLCIKLDFNCSGANSRSCTFLQSPDITIFFRATVRAGKSYG